MNSRAQARQARLPLYVRFVFSGVNSCPWTQCVRAAFIAIGLTPRSTFSRCVTGSR